MKRSKYIVGAVVATLLVGTAQVMAADQQQTRDRLNLECNECEVLFDESTAVKDQVRDRDQLRDHVASQDGTQAKNQYRYRNSENYSVDRSSSVESSSNSGVGGGMGKGKGHR